MDAELEPRTPAPTRQRWRDEAGTRRETISGVFHLRAGWACLVTLEQFGGAWGVAGVQLRPAVDLLGAGHEAPARALTTAQLKALRLGAMAADLRRAVLDHPDVGRIAPDLTESLRRKPGPAGASDLEYARLAARYVQLVDEGSTSPNEDLAEELGDGWDAALVRDWLHRARHRRGLLTPTRRGQAGGRLTDKARELLAAEED